MMPGRRKKWTEAEERSLIDKYGEMVSDGTLSKMKTREKKFKPISSYVNSVHHSGDPIAYPWQWTWKDVSTKVQNMRHQYLLVKQKIKKPPLGEGESSEEFDWEEGLTHWSNFLRYKAVFGDFGGVVGGNNGELEAVGNGGNGFGDGGELGLDIVFGEGIDGIGLDFEYNGESFENGEGQNGYFHEEEDEDGTELVRRKRRRKLLKGLGKKAWGMLGGQLRKLRELEARFEQKEVERERERERREGEFSMRERERECRWEAREKAREARERERAESRERREREWEEMEKESEERERVRREEDSVLEREWEERMNRRRSEWRERMGEMMSQHRAEMGEIQSRIVHEQQALSSQLLGIVSQWTTHPAAISDHASASNQYFSQMMQNLQHVNRLVHDEGRVEGESQDDQFIVDG